MNQTVAVVSEKNNIFKLIEKSKSQFAMALGRNLDPGAFTRVCLTVLRTNPKLMNCSQESLLGALMTSAQLGLAPDGILGQAYLVPYKTKCTLIIGYKGLVTLAIRSGHVRSVRARMVYENDQFNFQYGMVESLTHVPSETDRGEPKAVYAVAEFVAGGHLIEVMFKDQVEAHRDKFSQAYKFADGKDGRKDSPWHTDPDSMWEKTVIRSICGKLPMSTEAQHVMSAENNPEMDIDGDVFDVEPETVEEDVGKPSRGVDGLVDASNKKLAGKKNTTSKKDKTPLEEKEQEAVVDETVEAEPKEITQEDAMLADCREAIEDHLKDVFSANPEARLKRLKFYVAETVGIDFANEINGVSDLDNTMIRPVWDYISKRKNNNQ